MNGGKSFFLYVLVFLCFDTVFCQDLVVSFIDKTDTENVKIELNQTLQLKGLKLKNINSAMNVVIPYYIKNNIQYPYFSFIDLRFKAYVISSIKSNTINGMSPNSIEYKILRIRQNFNDSNICASTFVTFNDLIEIECFIIKDKNTFKILWPSAKSKNKINRLLFSIKDLALQGQIENEILNKYKIENRKTE